MKILYLTPEDDLQKAFSGLKGPAEIRLAKGVYRQKTEICADNVTVYGEDRETTVLSYGDYAKKYMPTARNTTLSARIPCALRETTCGFIT